MRFLNLLILGFLFVGSGFSEPGKVQASGRAVADTREAALRLAKAEAFGDLFKALKKDDLFANLFLSDPVVFGQTVYSEEEINVSAGKVSAEITITVRQDNLNLIQQRYSETLTAVLNQAEAQIALLETLLKEGEASLEKKDVQTAFRRFTEVEGKAAAVEKSLQPFSDPAIRSQKLNNKEILLSALKLKRDLAQNGLTRLAEVEKLVLAEGRFKEVKTAWEQYAAQQKEARTALAPRLRQAPFYDLPREKLENWLLEARTQTARLRDIRSGLDRTSALAAEAPILLREQLAQSLTENSELQMAWQKIENDLNREISDPRMGRLEREQRDKALWSEVGKSFAGILGDRPTRENLALRVAVPPRWDGGLDWQFDTFQLRVEGAYQDFWLHSRLFTQGRGLTDGSRQWTLSQDLGLAVGKSAMLGGGLRWDWFRQVYGGSEPGGRAGIFSLLAFWGSWDDQFDWPLWLVTGSWEAPSSSVNLSLESLFNAGVEAVLRPGNLFKLEGGARSHVLPRLNPKVSFGAPVSDYEAQAWLAVGLKIPSAVLWQVKYENRYLAPVGQPGSNSPLWTFSLEYSF